LKQQLKSLSRNMGVTGDVVFLLAGGSKACGKTFHTEGSNFQTPGGPGQSSESGET
jgi:hypothetical protein